MDLMSTKEHFLAWINIACADDSDASRIDFRSPATDIDKLTIAQASQSSEDHPVYIAGRSRLFSIEIRMGVDPEHSQLPMYTGNSTDGTQCNAMITSDRRIIPCILPEGVVSSVLKSGWASIQSTPNCLCTRATPLMEPSAML